MSWKDEWKALLAMVALFLGAFFLPVEFLRESARLKNAVWESLHLVRWYAEEHVLLCLVPAFFIAGAIGVFVSQASVMKYLGPKANRALAYGVASVSGTILAVCSCTVLPLFSGIYRRGAGLGPATAFLYSGPAINVLAIVMTARILGLELGIARAVGAVLFSVVIGFAMHVIFRHEERERSDAALAMPAAEPVRSLGQNALFFGTLAAILVFANWARPAVPSGVWWAVFSIKWPLTAGFACVLLWITAVWFRAAWWKLLAVGAPTAALAAVFPGQPLAAFTAGAVGLSWIVSSDRGEGGEWFSSTWGFAKQILPLLLAGVLVSGFLLGRPGQEGLIPSAWVARLVGGNSPGANFFASVVGAFMYFATLTEVPILQGLIGSGMGKGPALALLLAGPALSLPSMLVLRSIMGGKKTVVYVALVVAMATITGLLYGALFGS